MNELSDYERKVLRQCAGLDAPEPWGAAIGSAMDVLRGRGYIDREGKPTTKGWDYLDLSMMG